MNRILLLFIIVIGLGTFQSCKTKKQGEIDLSADYRVGFYNVENLFDTIDTPDKFDGDFTPSGKLSWNTERYGKKLNDLDRVVAAMGYPTLLGICEVENKAVLEDFAANTGMSKHDYGVEHFESPDRRGIDCALMYQKKYFKVTQSEKIRINFPSEIVEDYTTRDILYTQGVFLDQFTLHVFVNHWPSRRGGLEKSEPKRTYVAQQLRDAVDEIFESDPNANIIILGDMNDEPANNSILKTLNAVGVADDLQPSTLYNCMAKLDQQNKGSYNYRGNWNLLDNIITSSSLLDPASKLQVQKPTIFQEEWMMYKNPKYGATPNRTFGGPNYYGGFSDHLPVYVELKVKK